MKLRLRNPLVTAPVLIGLVLAINTQLAGLRAQNTVFTYQGQVLDNGAPFTGIGQFQFALVTISNANQTATATANAPSGGFITGYNVTFGGNGYATAPAVIVIGGGGSGAAATTHLTAGSVTSISVANTGNGSYTNTPIVLVAPPPQNLSYTTYWSNDGASVGGSEPALAVSVPVSNGLFTVTLGDATQPGMAVVPVGLFHQQNLQLRIWFSDGTNGFVVLNPAQNLTPVPYAVAVSSLSGLLTVQQDTNGAPNVIIGSSVNFVSNGVVGATIAGGGATNYGGSSYTNSVTVDFGTVSGGANNTAAGDGATIGGGIGNSAYYDSSTVSGGRGNAADYFNSTVGGGTGNTANGEGATIGGGDENNVNNDGGTISGGAFNTSGSYCTVAGGEQNNATNQFATVSGGQLNGAADYSTVGGGIHNIANGPVGLSTVSGGGYNTASGSYSTIPGGYQNQASGLLSFAAGNQAQALNFGSFVWSDASGSNFASTANNQFAVRASGGLLFAGDVQLEGGAPYHNLSLSGGNSQGYLYGSYPALGDGVHLGYNYYYDANGNGHVFNAGGATSRLSLQYGQIVLAVGLVDGPPSTNRLVANMTGVTVYGTFNQSSDRNAKQDFAPINPARILEKVGQLPITEWSYKEDPKTRHVGPVAQDFYTAFNIGTDEKHIAPIDEGGVALAAIKGLNQKLEAKLEEKDAEIQSLKDRLDKIEALLNQQNAGGK